MAQGKKTAAIAGVAEGKQLVPVATDAALSAEDKARIFVSGAMSGEYKVRFDLWDAPTICYLILTY
jgi:hypothetical protein